jgi:hypothetical protein
MGLVSLIVTAATEKPVSDNARMHELVANVRL